MEGTVAQSKSTFEVARAGLVFYLCTLPFLVSHSQRLICFARAAFGRTIAYKLVEVS